MKNDILVSLKGVTKKYGNVTAADNVNLTISRGEFLVFLGLLEAARQPSYL